MQGHPGFTFATVNEVGHHMEAPGRTPSIWSNRPCIIFGLPLVIESVIWTGTLRQVSSFSWPPLRLGTGIRVIKWIATGSSAAIAYLSISEFPDLFFGAITVRFGILDRYTAEVKNSLMRGAILFPTYGLRQKNTTARFCAHTSCNTWS